MADDIVTPDEWDGTEWAPLHVLAHRHDHKGHSEEMCIRCGWVMGHIPLNCQNDDSPHVFPSQQAEIERLRAVIDNVARAVWDCGSHPDYHAEVMKRHEREWRVLWQAIHELLAEARRG